MTDSITAAPLVDSIAGCRTVVEPILNRAKRDPEWPGLVFIHEDGRRQVRTAGEIGGAARAAAACLRTAGVGAGDVVVLAMNHTPQLIDGFLGAMCLGAIPTIFPAYVNDRLDAEVFRRRVEMLVRGAAARAVVTLSAHADALRPQLAAHGCAVLSACTSGNVLSDADLYRNPDAIAFLQFTSGAGGIPKGIAHTHRRLLHFLEMRRYQPCRTDEVVVSWLPLYHDLGLVSCLLIPLVHGLRTVLMSPMHWVRDPKILWQAMTEFGGTITYVPNFALNLSVQGIRERDLAGFDLRRCRAVVLGGEPVRARSLRDFAERFAPCGFRASTFRNGYGMAELIEAATVTPSDTEPRVDWVDLETLQRQGRAVPTAPDTAGALSLVSCGPPIPHTDLDIRDDAGATLPERCVGEIVIRSPIMMHEYYQRPDLTAETIRDGWLYSGDLGYLADGQLYVVGRRKDLIIVAGKNVQPDELERIADGVPGLYPGRTVAFGVADERLGSDAIVVVCETAPDLSLERRTEIEQDFRRRVVQEMDVTVSEVRLVGRGWVIKTSSGKHARPANRAKYLREYRSATAPPSAFVQ